MNPFKLQILQEEEDRLFWNDFYLDMDSIVGFYVVADTEMIDGEFIKPIVLYVWGENYTIKPQAHIEDYLLKRFVNPCVEI